MKKAKIMLSAIALFTLVGGAFAFKAHNAFNGSLYCTSVKGNVPTTAQKFAVTPGGQISYCLPATTTPTTAATITYTVTVAL